MPSSRESSPHRDWTCVSCIGRQILDHWATWETHGWDYCLFKGDPREYSYPLSNMWGQRKDSPLQPGSRLSPTWICQLHLRLLRLKNWEMFVVYVRGQGVVCCWHLEGRDSATGKILKCIGPSTAKNYPGENVSRAKADIQTLSWIF